MDKEQVERIIKGLEAVRKRPGMYIMSDDAAFDFIVGFNLALHLVGFWRNSKPAKSSEESRNIYKEVVTERGWEWSTIAPYGEMKARGLSREEKIDEVLAIEIECWKRSLAEMDDENSDDQA